MKKYTFQIKLTEEDLKGDEFWEEIIKKDPSGIVGLTEAIKYCIQDQLLGGQELSEDAIKLIKFEDGEI